MGKKVKVMLTPKTEAEAMEQMCQAVKMVIEEFEAKHGTSKTAKVSIQVKDGRDANGKRHIVVRVDNY